MNSRADHQLRLGLRILAHSGYWAKSGAPHLPTGGASSPAGQVSEGSFNLSSEASRDYRVAARLRPVTLLKDDDRSAGPIPPMPSGAVAHSVSAQVDHS
jgi:hypothetical protein